MGKTNFPRTVAALILVFVSFSIFAADGDLDPTFNSTGYRQTSFGDSAEEGRAVKVQPDGKIIVVGFAANNLNELAVVRYNADGTLDTTFDGDGKTTVIFSQFVSSGFALALQSDGKIVVVGSATNPTSDFAIARLNSNGSLDATFGTNGKVITPIGTSTDVANAVAIQTDGKIVVAGSTRTGSNDDFALVRYNTDGSLDTTFDVDGKVTTAIGSGNEAANGLTLQADGKIIAVGYTFAATENRFAVVRYNTDGSLDTAFDTDGIVSEQIYLNTALDDTAYAAAVQSDGKIVIAVSAENGSGTNTVFATARLNSNGSLDTSFGGAQTSHLGTAVMNSSNESIPHSIGIQSDGKIVMAGSLFPNSFRQFYLGRFNTNGSPDSATFGTIGNGETYHQVGTAHSIIYGMDFQPDGKIVAAGVANNGVTTDFALARYSANGIPDTSFDTDGNLLTKEIGSNYSLNDIAIQTDGKIVSVGNVSNTTLDFGLIRQNANGTLDTTFGTGGKASTDFGADDSANSVAIQSDGKIVVVGNQGITTAADFAVARYNSNGTLDTTFSGDGQLTFPIGALNDLARSVKIQSDGKIVIAGSHSSDGVTFGFAIVRLTSDGTFDTAFDTDGIITTAIGTTGEAFNLAIQADGKILAGGYATIGNQDFAIARYNTNGSLDTTFDTDGIVTTAMGTSTDHIRSVKLQPDGKIVVGGLVAVSGGLDDFGFVRFNPDGSFDSTFGTGGKSIITLSTTKEDFRSMVIQPNGKILAVGTRGASSFDHFLARLNADGSLDSTAFAPSEKNLFGTAGTVTTNVVLTDRSLAVALHPNGRIIVGGQANRQAILLAYQNSLGPTAANAQISGRILTSDGRGIRNVIVRLTDSNGVTQTRISSTFGYYNFNDLPVGETYILTVSAKRFTFANPSRVITLSEDLTDTDFIAETK